MSLWARGRERLRLPGSGQIVLAITPLVLAYLGYLVSWGWRSAGWPTVLLLPPTYLITLALLVLGALVGLRRGTPPWAYTWLAHALHNLAPLARNLLALALLPEGGRISGPVQEAFAFAGPGLNQFLVFLAVMAALLLARRSRQDAFFFFLLFLGARVVTYPIQIPGTLLVPSDAVTGALAAIGLAEGAVMGLLIYRFLTGDPGSWRPFKGLLALVLVEPLLKLWPMAIQAGSLGRNLRSLGIALGINWLLITGFLGVVYLAVWLYQTRRSRRA
jgi:hypothetical protein